MGNLQRRVRVPLRLMLRLILLAGLSGPALGTWPVAASGRAALSYAIAAGPLRTVVAQFAAQAGLQVHYAAELPATLQAHGLKGSYPVAAAWAQLLAGTGLVARCEGDEYWIEPAPAPAAVALGELAVGGETGGGDSAIYGRSEPHSHVGRAALQTRFAGDPQMAVRSMPGSFSRQRSDQPGIEVNIRGLSGYGRVNAMLDGIPQTFKNVASHAASGGSLLYVQPELLTGIDVTRGAVAGAHGMGTLAGAANFHTLGVEDVLLEGHTQGLFSRVKLGEPGPRYGGTLAYARRWDRLWGGEGRVDAIAALAYSHNGSYLAGGQRKLPGGLDGYAAADAPRGGLLKLEVAANPQQSLALGARWYANTFNNSSYRWHIDNRSWSAGYHYTPGRDWLSLDLDLYLNQTRLAYLNPNGSYAGRRTEDKSYGLAVSDLIETVLGEAWQLRIQPGLSWARDDFSTRARRGGNHPGRLDKSSLFVDAALTLGRLTLQAGLRRDGWRLRGWRAPYPAGSGDCPPSGPACGNRWVSREGGRWLPRLGVVYQLTPGWQLQLSQARTYRPPSSHEAFFALVPFGQGKGSGVANNLDLKPELSQNWELGAAYSGEGVWRDGDHLNLRLNGFYTTLRNYIVNDFVEVPGWGETAMWVNRPGRTRQRGLELEGRYDAGLAYAELSLSATHTGHQPLGQGAGAGNGEGAILPSPVATLELGLRLLGRKLELGLQGRYVGGGREAVYNWNSFENRWGHTAAYTLLDMHGSYVLSRHSRIFFSLENLADRRYGYAGAGYDAYTEQSGRGRSLNIGFSGRF